MKAKLRVIYCAVAALGVVTVLSAQDVQTTWPVALAVALGTWLSASLIAHHYAQRPARQDKPSITAAAGAQMLSARAMTEIQSLLRPPQLK